MWEAYQSEGVRGFLHRPDAPPADALILTHGAGSNAAAPLLVAVAEAFAAAGFLVLRYDLPFRQSRAFGPPNPRLAEHDREGIGQAFRAAQALTQGRVFAGGHSYGGRQTAVWASEHPGAAALLLLSYPLHPPGKPDRPRTDFFPNWRTPALFLHGSEDPFGSLEEMLDALTLIPARTELLLSDGASHDLKRATKRLAELPPRLAAMPTE
ncbi:MAG TPA: alpha/beta family hydrolase [Bryobacteraceae bacterium]|nr:alpha/beta family hydrolase [Bryobacteraceae bacterium]